MNYVAIVLLFEETCGIIIIIMVLVVEINAINRYNGGDIFDLVAKRRKYPKYLLSKRKKKYHFFSRYLKTKKMLPVCTSAQPIIQPG